MNDEANTHWFSMLEQLTVGNQWLKRNLNYSAKSSWSIDPFGQSATFPLILKLAGFENLLIQRVHYSVKKHFARMKQLEFNWRQISGWFITHPSPSFPTPTPASVPLYP